MLRVSISPNGAFASQSSSEIVCFVCEDEAIGVPVRLVDGLIVIDVILIAILEFTKTNQDLLDTANI